MKDIIIKFKDGSLLSLKETLFKLLELSIELGEHYERKDVLKLLDEIIEAIEEETKKSKGMLRPVLKQKFINIISKKVKLYWDWKSIDFIMVIK